MACDLTLNPDNLQLSRKRVFFGNGTLSKFLNGAATPKALSSVVGYGSKVA